MVELLETINGFVWGVPALFLILGIGIYFSIATRFIQLRLLPRALKGFFAQIRSPRAEKGCVSQFQALCTALAATVGTGNLAGVAGAIAIGGPGVIFWMWVSALLGMVTKFAEAALAVRYRTRNDRGEYVGGPMYMIRGGMKQKWWWLGGCYCFLCVVAAFGVGNGTQVNAVICGINDVMRFFGKEETFHGNMIMGIFLAAAISAMLMGGARRIGQIAECLVPFAAIGYILFCAGALAVNYRAIPAAFHAIVTGAFSPRAVTGGMVGSAFLALRTGVSRGVFTNEAGMGSASIAHAGAQAEHPVNQGMMGMVEVFLDTIVICTLTALVILTSGVGISYGTDQGVLLTTGAFASVFGDWVSIPIALFLCSFAFATILGWGLYGGRCAQYLFGDKVWKVFVTAQGITVVVSAVLNTQTVWMLSEVVNGLMVIPNLIVLAALRSELIRLVMDYTNRNPWRSRIYTKGDGRIRLTKVSEK